MVKNIVPDKRITEECSTYDATMCELQEVYGMKKQVLVIGSKNIMLFCNEQANSDHVRYAKIRAWSGYGSINSARAWTRRLLL